MVHWGSHSNEKSPSSAAWTVEMVVASWSLCLARYRTFKLGTWICKFLYHSGINLIVLVFMWRYRCTLWQNLRKCFNAFIFNWFQNFSSILFIVGFSLLLRLERWRPSLGLAATLIAFGLVLFTWRAEHLDLRGLSLVELAAFCTGIWQDLYNCVFKYFRHSMDGISTDHARWWTTVSAATSTWYGRPRTAIHAFDHFTSSACRWRYNFVWWFLKRIRNLGQEINVTSVTNFKDSYQPMLVLLLVLFGGFIAFLMEMSEYLLLVNTSGITLNILGIIKVCRS